MNINLMNFGPLMFLIIAWSLYWKGHALWRAAKSGNKNWFIALLVINTVGILDIIYIYYICNDNESGNEENKDDNI